jgi:hypothetical protein
MRVTSLTRSTTHWQLVRRQRQAERDIGEYGASARAHLRHELSRASITSRAHARCRRHTHLERTPQPCARVLTRTRREHERLEHALGERAAGAIGDGARNDRQILGVA